MDFEDLERKLSDPQTTLMLLCNPHNPVGRIWSREELGQAGELCRKYHVTVISDEIHCDLTAPGQEYVPFASVSKSCRNNSITCIAPTKAFNLAGLKTAAAFCGGFSEERSSTDQAGFFTGYLSDVAGLPGHEGMCNGIYAVSEGAHRIVSVGRTSVWGKRKFLYQNEYRMSQKQAGGWAEASCRGSQRL